ncbi:MAG: PAS domain S-box protein [Candidatus Heimdallarchaeota archaeon]
MAKQLMILHLEDNQNDVELVKEILDLEGLKAKVISVDTKDAFIKVLKEEKIDLILADYSLPSFDGLSALELTRKMGLKTPFILVSAVLGEELAIEALHSGATDYVLKSRMERLIPAINRALKEVEERKRRAKLEKEISELEEMYRKIAERVRGFLKMDLPSGKYSLVDKFIEELSGYSIKEWYKSPNFIEKILHPDFKDYYRENFQRMREGFVPKMLEYKIIRKDGEERWWLQFNIGAYNTEQELVSVSIVLIDNTETKESTLKYQYLFENALVGMYRTEITTGRIIEANETMARIFGFDTVDEYKKIFVTQFYPDEKNRQEFLATIKAHGTLTGYQLQLLKKNGEKIWVSLSARIFPEEGFIEGVIIDITEQKKAQRELFEREHELENIFEHKGTATIIIEKDMIISKCNHQIETISGFKKKELEGKRKWTEFVHPDDLPRLLALDKQHRERNSTTPIAFECKIKHKAGHYFDAFLTASVIPGTTKSIASIIDVSKRKKAEQELTRDRLIFKLIAEAAVQTIDLRDLCQKVLTGLVENLGFDSGLIRIYFENERLLLPMAEVGLSKEARETLTHVSINNTDFPLSRFLTKEIIEPDVLQNDFLRNTDINAKFHYRSYISWPIFNSNQKFLGIIQIGSQKKIPLQESDRIFFENISKIFATAIERKMAEDALRESESQYRKLVESLPVQLGLLIVQEDEIKFASPTVFEMFEVSSIKDIIGSDLITFFSSESWEEMRVFLHSIYQSDGAPKLKLETKLKRASNEEFPAEIFATLTSYQGEPAVQLLISDLTERKKAEEAICDSEARYRTLVETSPFAIFLLSLEGDIHFVNKQAPKSFGMNTESELLGKNLFAFIVDKTTFDQKEFISEILHAGRVRNYELLFHRQDKTTFYADFSASVIVDAKGVPQAIMAIIQDITERKQIERNRRLLANIVENSKEVIITANEDGKILFANAAIEEILGYQPESIIGKDITLFAPPGSEEKQRNLFKSTLELGKVTFESILRQKNGILIPVIMTYVVIDDKEFNEKTINIIILDTSDLVELKETLKDRTFELETLNKVISAGYLARNMNELLDFTLTTVLNSLDFNGGAIYLIDEEKEQAFLKRSLGMSANFIREAKVLKIKSAPFKELFVAGRTIYVDNFMAKSEGHQQFGIQTLIGVPFFSKQVVIGGLLLSSKERRSLAKDELMTLEAIGREMGTALAKMQAEEELQSSQKYLQTIFNALENYILVFNKETNQILNVNIKFQEKLGYDLSKLLTMDIATITTEKTQKLLKNTLKSLRDGESKTMPLDFITQDGKVFSLKLHLSVIVFLDHQMVIAQN